MSLRVSRGFPSMLDLLQSERTWIVVPVQEGYLKVPGVKVVNVEKVLQDLQEISDAV
jgi:hypothetical protein